MAALCIFTYFVLPVSQDVPYQVRMDNSPRVNARGVRQTHSEFR